MRSSVCHSLWMFAALLELEAMSAERISAAAVGTSRRLLELSRRCGAVAACVAGGVRARGLGALALRLTRAGDWERGRRGEGDSSCTGPSFNNVWLILDAMVVVEERLLQEIGAVTMLVTLLRRTLPVTCSCSFAVDCF